MDNYGPCEVWPIRWQCDFDCESPAVTAESVEVATEILWALSGRQFGFCTSTLRPCRRDNWESTWTMPQWLGGYGYPYPALIGGQWFNLGCGSCAGDCSCSVVSEVKLPANVDQIVEVKIDGSPLVTGAYRLDNNRILVRTDGDVWPWCNDLSKADTEPDTWSVTARYGQTVPRSGEWAMGEMACQLTKAIMGREDCRLPRNVTQLVRQGVTISFPDVSELFEKGRTGLYLVDLFIAAVNPNHLAATSRTYNVDAPVYRRAGT